MPKVLLVDDEESIRFALSEVMEVNGIEVRTAGGAISRGASSRTRAATGARSPRVRRWSPKRSKSADRACTSTSLPHALRLVGRGAVKNGG